jgi:hypothetical protein
MGAELAGRLTKPRTTKCSGRGHAAVLARPVRPGRFKQQEADYARLKGEYDAIQQAAITKKTSPCPRPW